MSKLEQRRERVRKERCDRIRKKLMKRLDTARQVRLIAGASFGTTVVATLAANWGWVDIDPAPFQTWVSVQWETTLGLGTIGLTLTIAHAVAQIAETQLSELDTEDA